MASVSKRNNKYFIRVYIRKEQKYFYGFSNKREAERIGEKIKDLVTARETGGKLEKELKIWVNKLADSDSGLYAKLAKLGLVEPVQEKHTLDDLIERYHAGRQNMEKITIETYAKPEKNLRDFFGTDCELFKITPSRADEFAVWLRTEPLNQRKKKAVPYSKATVNKRIGYIKQLFKYAKRIGWLPENPFDDIKGGDSVNHEKWHYVDRDTIMQVLDACCLPKWRAIIALGRFAGLRGSSETYGLRWEDVQWSSDGQPGELLIRAEKNKRHGKIARTVPMCEAVERELRTLFDLAKEGETHVFPKMEKRTNFGTMMERAVKQAFVPVWPSLWYNLRKSFCCDLMEAGIDPVVYEAITDHSYAVAMKHYQMPHTARLQKGYEKVREAMGLKKALAVHSKSDSQCIHENGRISQQELQTPYFYDSLQETENPCEILHGILLEINGLEPMTLALQTRCSTN